MSIQSVEIKNGVKLHYLHTKKFKTNSLGVYFHRPMQKSEATINALLSNVIKRGCPLFPRTKELARQLEALYGSKVVSGVRKKGDSQVIYINFEFVNENYVLKSQPVMENILDLVKSMVFAQEGFLKEYVSQEKENLKQLIMAQMNDKRAYAAQRCVEIMCKQEPYGICELGFIDDVDGINEGDLFEHYKNVVLKSPVDIFITGDVDIFWVEQKIKEMLEYIEVKSVKYPETVIIKDIGEIKNVTETQNIAQGKLSLGFRTKTASWDEKYPALLIYNAVFGGGPFSKLFNNVREKLSLAYYASSRLDMFKGVMIVNSGIEVANFQKAYDEIMTQFKAMANGDITDEEMSAAVLSTVNNIRSMTDSAMVMEDYWLGRLITGTALDIDELISMLKRVTKQQVIEVAQNVDLDTVYFLKGV
ncbi:MAG: pitrilysin family protein [Eubacteriales bacterium]|jgi:predicted Zn-dependent peptidase|nr:pitrilysin family protein [Eubacteriales bacterium]